MVGVTPSGVPIADLAVGGLPERDTATWRPANGADMTGVEERSLAIGLPTESMDGMGPCTGDGRGGSICQELPAPAAMLDRMGGVSERDGGPLPTLRVLAARPP
jgi:hypothetical protein